ncbi:MAG: DNA repair protein RecO [Bacteroidetes bacterium]|nr:DNA repair protein RecO [Bacteroidota bacterium]
MLISTTGIIFHVSNYSETSLIAKVYTRQFGLQSYIVKGVRKKGSKIKRNLFGPLSVVELVAYQKENSGLHTIRDVSCHRQFNEISTDIIKSSILLFMNELLYRSIHDEMPDPGLFSFILESLNSLESLGENLAGFPQIFALQLSDHLGFAPHKNYTARNSYFDLQEGRFAPIVPEHNYFLLPEYSKSLAFLLQLSPGMDDCLDHSTRLVLLEKILQYFRLHLPSFGEMKSPHILNTVLRD